jgi:hypothetical protein
MTNFMNLNFDIVERSSGWWIADYTGDLIEGPFESYYEAQEWFEAYQECPDNLPRD